MLLLSFISCPVDDLFEDKFAGAFRTLEIPVIVGLDTFESLK